MADSTLVLETATLGAELSAPEYLRSIELAIQPATVFLSLATVIPAANETVVLPPIDQALLEPEWVEEGAEKKVDSTTFSRTSVSIKEIAVIVKFSEKLMRNSFVDVQAHIRDMILERARVKIDSSMWAGAPDTEVPGAITGFLEDVGSYQSVTVGVAENLGLDMLAMAKKLALANYDQSSGRWAYACHPSVLYHLRSLVTGSEKLPLYPSVQSLQPTIWGIPLRVSNNLPATYVHTDDTYISKVTLASWDKVWVFTQDSEIRIADQATVSGTELFTRDLSALRWVAHYSSPVVRDVDAIVCMEVEV